MISIPAKSPYPKLFHIPPKYHYTAVDCPGHRDFIKNMIEGCATADVGLLLVPADGGFTTSIQKGDRNSGAIQGNTRQHARLLNIMGVKQLIVGINKMDDPYTCQWSEARYNEIKDETTNMLISIGWAQQIKEGRVAFIPLSGWLGDNLITKSANMPWYKGWSVKVSPTDTRTGFTLLEALDNIVPPARIPEKPLLFAITNVYDSTSKLSIQAGEGNVIVTGCVYQGKIQCNDIVGAICSGQRGGMVKRIENDKNEVNMASAGDNVGE
jgi:elongation factor 1-alpha